MLGLPLHPLIVHAAVILVPIAALGAVAVVLFGTLRTRYGWLTVVATWAAALSALGARFTGPILAEELRLEDSDRIATHMMWGWWTPWPPLLLAVSLTVFLWSVRPDSPRRGVLRTVSAVLSVLAALISLVLIALTGHSGATAVWGP